MSVPQEKTTSGVNTPLKWHVFFFLSPSPLPPRCQALQHSCQLSRGDQAVRLWCKRPAHRFHGQLLCWNALLHVGESALHACTPTPFPLALSPLSFSFLTLLLSMATPSAFPSLGSLCQEQRSCVQQSDRRQRAKQMYLLFLSPPIDTWWV